MATEAEIRVVREKLGPDAAQGGWTDTRIDEDLTLGKTPNEIALAWWEYRASNTAHLVDVNESGSSRTLSRIHSNAVAMAERYKSLVDAENEITDPALPTRGPGIRTFPIRRIAR